MSANSLLVNEKIIIMGNRKLRIERKIYPDLEKSLTPKEINKRLERFKVSIDFLFDDGLEFTYDSNLDVRNFPGDISFIDKKRNIVILSYLEGFSSIDFFVGDDIDFEDKEPYISIPIYNFLNDFLMNK